MKKGWTLRQVRQTASQVSYIGAGLSLVICGSLTNPGAAFTFMVISLLFFGASQSGIACCYLDIAPRYSSIMNTLGNTIGALAGLAGPLVVSSLLNNYRDFVAWQLVFIITLIQSIIALIFFHFYQSDKIVDVLNNPYKPTTTTTTTS